MTLALVSYRIIRNNYGNLTSRTHGALEICVIYFLKLSLIVAGGVTLRRVSRLAFSVNTT